jgi:hypothetical protein
MGGGQHKEQGAVEERANIFLFNLPLLWEDNLNCLEHRILSFRVTKQGSCFYFAMKNVLSGEGQTKGPLNEIWGW